MGEPEFGVRSDTHPESDSGKRAKESGVRDQRYSIRYPFAADAEMMELESGRRARGVTSDLSLGGCFVCALRTLEVLARVRGTLTHENRKVKMLAVVRVVKPLVGMGLEFLDTDPDSHATLLTRFENLRKSRCNLSSHREVCITPKKFLVRSSETAEVHAIWSLNHSVEFIDDRPAVFQFHAPGRQLPIRRASYLFRRARAQTSGFDPLQFYTMNS